MINKVKLGDVCDLSIGFVGTVTSQYEEGGIPFFRTLNVKPYKIVDDDLKRITLEFHESQKKSQLREGDIAMVHTGVPGICCVIPKEYDNSNCIDMIVIKPHKDLVNPHYLAAYMNTIGYKHIEKLQVGCIQKHFNLKDAIELEIFLPDIETQNKIGHLIAEINNKIEINNSINTELESMAKTVYDYWFLQYDFPCEDGRPYKSSGGKMVWNEEVKTEIPIGWNVKTLSSMGNLTMGQSPKSESYNEEEIGLPLINGAAELQENGVIIGKYTSAPTRNCNVGDLIFCIRATIGNLQYAERKYCLGRGVAAFTVKDSLYIEYMYQSLSNILDNYKKTLSGSIIVGITKDDLKDKGIIVPSERIISLYSNIVRDIHDKIRKNMEEIKELTELREYLLPMLINGQVTFEEA